ncbi:hypothetical protein [Inquilinus sp. CAU 1745]|uniref:hypothetical protein n=1 Tax=Inquilinus sp. CAU 1745 TaxID=3140369 RepID=UPI00325BDA4C
MKRIHAMLSTVALMGFATAAVAQDAMTTEEQFFNLRQAVVAYERCNDVMFDQTQAEALDEQIEEITGENFGAGEKLTMIQDAKMDMSRQVTTKGCNDAEVASALATFETELAPALGAM